MAVSICLWIIILNVNGHNTPIKRHRVAEWIKEEDPSACYLQQTHFKSKNTHRLKFKGWKKIFHANGNLKKAGAAILISDKIYFGQRPWQKTRRTLYNNK